MNTREEHSEPRIAVLARTRSNLLDWTKISHEKKTVAVRPALPGRQGSISIHVKVLGEKNTVMGPDTKYDCAGDGQQQYTGLDGFNLYGNSKNYKLTIILLTDPFLCIISITTDSNNTTTRYTLTSNVCIVETFEFWLDRMKRLEK
jgi:hypothetical protein